MSEEWFYTLGDKQHGPFTKEQFFAEFRRSGGPSIDTWVFCKPDFIDWVPASSIPGLIPDTPARPPRSKKVAIVAALAVIAVVGLASAGAYFYRPKVKNAEPAGKPVFGKPLDSSSKALPEADLYGYWGFDEDYCKTVIEEMLKDKKLTQSQARSSLRYLQESAAYPKYAFSPGRIEFFGEKFRKQSALKTQKVEGNVFEFVADGHPWVFILENGRLIHKQDYDRRAKWPAWYLRRFSDAEVAEFNVKGVHLGRPPAIDAPVDDCLNFLGYRATAEQAGAMLGARKDLATMKTSDGYTALGLIRPTKIAVAEKLLASGADPSWVNPVDKCPLILPKFPSEFTSDEITNFAKLLVKYGAKVNSTNDEGESLLILSCKHRKNTKMLKWLIDSGADLNLKSKSWNSMSASGRAAYATALTYAADADWSDGVDLLINSGADLKVGAGLLQCVVRNRNLPLLKKLAEKGLTQDPLTDNTALMCAVLEINNCTRIIHGGDGYSASDKAGFAKKKAALIAFLPSLIEHDKARLDNSSSRSGYSGKFTALTYAGDVEVAKLLIDAGANVNGCVNDAHSPLYQSVASGSLEFVNFYISKGADVNLVVGGITPLQCCVMGSGKMDKIKVLVEAGANVNQVTYHGTVITMLLWYSKGNKDAVAYFDYLVSKGADIKICGDKNICNATDLNLIRRLAKSGLLLKTNEAAGALQSAVYFNDTDRIKLFLELGVDPNWKINDSIGSPLEWAKKYRPKDKAMLDLLSSYKSKQ